MKGRVKSSTEDFSRTTHANISRSKFNRNSTLLTSFTTFLAVGSIFLLGGNVLRGFSLAMLIGIVVGTYSSIYIASPVMLAFGPTQTEKS